jgi:hypothetical protein
MAGPKRGIAARPGVPAAAAGAARPEMEGDHGGKPELEARMSKHEKSRGESPFTSDLDRNPGIGQSKGSFATGEDPELLEGENSAQGDVDNDADAQGAVDENQRVRTNQ